LQAQPKPGGYQLRYTSIFICFVVHLAFRFFLPENSCLKNHTVSLLLYGNFRKKSSPSLKTQGFQKNPKKFEKRLAFSFQMCYYI